jgi:hypothetical protein
VLWAAGARFGPLAPEAPALLPGKRVLIDNTAALLSGGGHAPAMLRRYFDLAIEGVANDHRAPAGLEKKALLAWVVKAAERAGARDDPRELRERVLAAAKQRARPHAVAHLARRIHRFRTEMSDGHGPHRRPRA